MPDGASWTILGDASRATPRGPGDEVVAALVATAGEALAEADRRRHDVVAVGCAAPGPLDHRTGVVHVAPNVPGLLEFPLAERLASAFDGLPAFVDRDTAIAAIGEATVGAATGAHDFVYLTVSTGVGGAIVAGGRMVRGATGTAGEVGHLPVAFDQTKRCGCGSFGCVEAFAGGANLGAAYGTADAEDVYRAADRGEERARALIADSERALASLAIGLTNVLNPELIVVGGAIAEHQPAHVLEPMRRAVLERAFAVPGRAVRIVPAALGADVGMIGAVIAARERTAGAGGWYA